MGANIFVFVACGNKEHIETLHVSLTALKRFSKNPIWVVTDPSRNAVPIQHEHIIACDTPRHFSHHQASIFLKTRLHHLLPRGNRYCYLDSDVIALSEACNDIFSQWIPPIIFAPDHCRIRKFSATAVNCGCDLNWDRDRQTFEIANTRHDRNKQITDPLLLNKAERIRNYFDDIKHNRWKRWINGLRYYMSGNYFRLNNEFYYDKKNKCWRDAQQNIVLYEIDYRAIEKETGFTFDIQNNTWLNRHGDNLWVNECGHLIQYIQQTFGICITERDWQHWNGGVFLFEDCSHHFMQTWHQHTMSIFNNPKWKTRDQGTLAATVWQLGLQHHPTLDPKWNFIADYNKPGLDFNEDATFTDNHWASSCKPVFIHIYHHFGDNNWPVWQYVENIISGSGRLQNEMP
jgi:hypothetical protein